MNFMRNIFHSIIGHLGEPSKRWIYLTTCLIYWIIAFNLEGVAQLTTTYPQQQSYYYSSNSASGGGCGNFNQGTVQLGMYAHSASDPYTVSWRKFRTDASGSSTSNRNMQIGDSMIVTLSATKAYGRIGFALLASPSSTSSYAAAQSNYAIQVNGCRTNCITLHF